MFSFDAHAFLRRPIDLTCNVKKSHNFIKLIAEARKDIQSWQEFIENVNGKTIFNKIRGFLQIC